ncbi:hypothetical protein D3C83_284780 [compost metagenome]
MRERSEVRGTGAGGAAGNAWYQRGFERVLATLTESFTHLADPLCRHEIACSYAQYVLGELR